MNVFKVASNTLQFLHTVKIFFHWHTFFFGVL